MTLTSFWSQTSLTGTNPASAWQSRMGQLAATTSHIILAINLLCVQSGTFRVLLLSRLFKDPVALLHWRLISEAITQDFVTFGLVQDDKEPIYLLSPTDSTM